MSSLWTPEGEHRVPRPGGAEPSPPPADPDAASPTAKRPPRETEPELAAIEEELLRAPAEDVVANHCYGLFELAALHLGARPPQLAQARLAIDALGAVVDGLGERLGRFAKPLGDGLSQIRLAYVQIAGAASAPGDGSPGPG